jgi:hypothetical protein
MVVTGGEMNAGNEQRRRVDRANPPLQIVGLLFPAILLQNKQKTTLIVSQ